MSPKAYTEQEEQLARFAKAMGHPARMAILRFLAGQESCFFGDIHEVLPIAKAHRIATPQRVESRRIDPGRNRSSESTLLHQPGKLGESP